MSSNVVDALTPVAPPGERSSTQSPYQITECDHSRKTTPGANDPGDEPTIALPGRAAK